MRVWPAILLLSGQSPGRSGPVVAGPLGGPSKSVAPAAGQRAALSTSHLGAAEGKAPAARCFHWADWEGEAALHDSQW